MNLPLRDLSPSRALQLLASLLLPILSAGLIGGSAAAATQATSLTLLPKEDFLVLGASGGSFAPLSKDYQIVNPGSQTLNWAAAAAHPGIYLTPSAGSVAPGKRVQVTVTLGQPAIQSLAPGFYGSTLYFVDLDHWDGEYVNLWISMLDPSPVLDVQGGAGFQTSGPGGGPFSPGSHSYSVRNLGGDALSWAVTSTVPWLNISPSGGQLGSTESTTVTVSIDPSASQSLSSGSHPAQVLFYNLDNGQGNQSQSVILTIQQPAERARAKIQYQNVVADNGYPLRGEAITLADWNLDVMYAESHWRELRDDFHLNTVRLMISAPPQNWSGGPGTNCAPPVYRCYDLDYNLYGGKTTLQVIEDMVDLAAKHGMYIVLDYHPVGGYDLGHALNWWGVVAPHFANRTHVIYELANEPVAWAAEEYDPAAISFQQQVYNKIRQGAPQTCVLLWTFSHMTLGMKATVQKAPGISYANAAVAFHSYGPYALNGLNSLQGAYPVINTEIGGGISQSTYHQTVMQRVQDAENIGCSWLMLNGVQTTLGPGGNNPGLAKWEVFWPADPGAVSLY